MPWKPHEADAYREDDLSVVAAGAPKNHIVETQHNADGMSITYDTAKVPLFNLEHEIVGILGVSLDITDRVRRENELIKLSKAIDASPATVMLTDAMGNIEYVNPKFSELTGYGAAEVTGRNPRFLKSGNTPQSVYEELWAAISSGREWRGQFQNKKKHGEIYYESAIIAPVRDTTGKIVNYIAIKEDITERKRISTALKKSEEMYRMLSENTSDGIIHFNRHGEVDYMSPVYQKLFENTGTERKETHWKDICARIADEDRDVVIATLNAAIAEKKTEMMYHFRMKTGDGRNIRREDHAAFRYDDEGRYDGTYVICRDITTRILAEESLVQSNELLRTVLNGIPQAICWKDTESRFLGCNKVFARMAGMGDPADLTGKSDRDLSLDKSEIERIQGIDRAVMNDDAPRFDVRVCKPDDTGSVVEFISTVAPIHASNGRVSGCVTICDFRSGNRTNDMPKPI